MVTKKNRGKRFQKTRKQQRGGLKCTEPATWTPFKWSANSCWLDSFLLGLLHHSNKQIDSIIDTALDTINEQINVAKEYNTDSLPLLKRKRLIAEKMQYLRAHLRNAFEESFNTRNTETDLSKLREDIRTSLTSCPGGTIFKKGRFSSISEIWQFIVGLLSIPETIRYMEKQPALDQMEGSATYIAFSGFDLVDRSELNIYEYLTKVQRQTQRTFQYKRFGELVPIDIERMAGDSANGLDIITTPIILTEYMSLKTKSSIQSEYRLVTVICNTGGHYVSYIACDDTDQWMFYNDMIRSEEDRIIPVGAFDDWWSTPIPGTEDKSPSEYATWLLYIKL
jgi:hypothetical protein